MKNIKTYLIAILGIFILGSCGDTIVNLAPKNQLTTDVALSSLDGLEGSIFGVYERGRSPWESNDICLYKVCQTDIVQSGTHLADQAIFRSIFSADYQFNGSQSGVESIFNAYYVALSRCNIIIEGIDNVEMTETAANIARRDRVLGEAYYFRAYYHLNLVQRWENIVLADKVADDPNAEISLSAPDVVYPLIVSDLETAIDLLPETAVINSSGRVSKGVARHLLSKAHMDLGNWADAAALAEKVTTDPGYQLLNNLDDIFSVYQQDNKEVIFAWQFTSNDINHPQRVTQQFYPLYDRVEGVDRTYEQGGRPWSRLQPNKYYWTLFDDNDKRLDAWHKITWYYDSETETLPAGVSLGDPVTPENIVDVAGLGVLAIVPTTNKYWEDGSLGKTVEDAQGFRNIILYRVSEAYLIAAEAYWRAGNESKGLTFINALRKRAGVAEFSSLSQDIILDEQARELGHEGHRWEMLKRMGLLVERVRAHNPDAGPNFQDYHNRWPIPRTFVDLAKVAQNEGYTE